MSQHIGDMANLETLRAFEAAVATFCRVYDVTPTVVAADAHPGYLSTRWAEGTVADAHVSVQHHHAHVAAVMAEHRLDPTAPVIGFAFDGTGYGDDGVIWGGEILVATASGAERWAHLREVQLPGGDAAIQHPCRVALSHLDAAGVPWSADLAPVRHCDDELLGNLRRQLTSGFMCVPTTSMGRLFDGVASILGLRHQISFEAQAAIELEVLAERGTTDPGYPLEIDRGVIDAGPLIRAIVADLASGTPREDIALGFHAAVVGVMVAAATALRVERGLDVVVLSGGVFQNALLVGRCVDQLEAAGFIVHTHRLVPPNDGGLSLGQAFVAGHAVVDPPD